MNIYFQDTPLEQDTFNLLAPFNPRTEEEGIYTPYSIATWNYSYYFKVDSIESLNMWMHEICHVIELYHSNKKKRILIKDFGYRHGVMTIAGVKMEAWVISLQNLMSKQLYGRISTNLTTEGILETFNDRGVTVTNNEWEDMLKKYTKEHKKRGLAYYYDTWHKACKYVKENRYMKNI